jgi:SAM-dependent methyltransferase
VTTWDYTTHAAYYAARPNYADAVIDQVVEHVGARASDDFVVADVGAGTGNLTLMLKARGLTCIAVEPNGAMREHGMERTRELDVRWVEGTGEATGLATGSVNWVTMGSSFNTMDRPRALVETHRILGPGGYFSCMWNHRDLSDPLQQDVEQLIRRMVPTYGAGTRREDQTEVIEGSGLFMPVVYHEGSRRVGQKPETYLDAWRSTHNLKLHAGDRFEAVIAAIAKLVEPMPMIEMTYTTRAWTAQTRPE